MAESVLYTELAAMAEAEGLRHGKRSLLPTSIAASHSPRRQGMRHMHTNTHADSHACPRADTHARTHAHTCAPADTHTCMHAQTHRHAQGYTHMHALTDTHTHTHTFRHSHWGEKKEIIHANAHKLRHLFSTEQNTECTVKLNLRPIQDGLD